MDAELLVLGGVASSRAHVAHLSARGLVVVALVCGALYGGVMGSWDLSDSQRLLQVVYGAIKVPLMVAVSTLLCLPGFIVLSTILGLRHQLGRSLGAILASQASFTIALVSLGPVTRFLYSSGLDHRGAILMNGVMFALATFIAQLVLRRRMRVLVREAPRQAIMLWVWGVLYVFVGIQMGWMMRPFIGTPGRPITFFREEPFSNAYMALIDIIAR